MQLREKLFGCGRSYVMGEMNELSLSEKPQFILFKDVRYTSSPSPFMIIAHLHFIHMQINC